MCKAICIKKFIGECGVKDCPHGIIHDVERCHGATCITREGYCELIAEKTGNTLKGDNTHCTAVTKKIPTGHFKRMGFEVVDADYL